MSEEWYVMGHRGPTEGPFASQEEAHARIMERRQAHETPEQLAVELADALADMPSADGEQGVYVGHELVRTGRWQLNRYLAARAKP